MSPSGGAPTRTSTVEQHAPHSQYLGPDVGEVGAKVCGQRKVSRHCPDTRCQKVRAATFTRWAVRSASWSLPAGSGAAGACMMRSAGTSGSAR